MVKKFYVTTTIYYVNDEPHLGSAYTTLAGDIIARYYRQKLGADNVFFLTGTDEHGQKIQQTADEKEMLPLELANKVSKQFKNAWKLLNINYDFFIRTTNPDHKKIVSTLLQKIYDAGYIYEGVYKGLYCIGCERFLTENDLINNKCPLHPNKSPVYQEEKNYFIKLKELVKKEVLPRIESGEYNILPKKRKNEIVSRIKEGVEDVSISREGVSWGIPLPWDKKQTVYVWVDALTNYYSATRFIAKKRKFWPADLHLIGKDILWFHSVIWQAMLIAANIKLPNTIFAHGFFTVNGQKMSKSLGNVIRPKELIDKYGVDGTRYLLISACTFGSDGNISLKDFDTKYNADLANGLGNLVSRVSKLCENLNKKIDIDVSKHRYDKEFIKLIENYKFDKALKIIWDKISRTDKFINENEPWKLKGCELENVLTSAVSSILNISLCLKPFLPETSEKITQIFTNPKIKSANPLFPRL